MKHPLADFLRASLIPVLRADISACAPCDIHFALVAVSAFRTAPNKFSVGVFDDFDFTVKTALLAIVAFRIKLGIHYVVVDVSDYEKHCGYVVLHIGNLHIAYSATG